MKYEIAYVSLSGNSEKLAHGIADRLPVTDTVVTDLSCEEISKWAEIYILCFGVNKGSIPLKIMESLEMLEGKTIAFCVTSGMEPIVEYRDKIERKLMPFLPDKCDYKGTMLFQGKFPEKVLLMAKQKLEAEPDNSYAKRILEDSELAQDHPNDADYEKACGFLANKGLL